MSGRVLVAGGSGFVGKQVVQALELAGYHVDIVSRKPKELKGIRNNAISWEAVKEDGLPKGTVGVVNTAGENVLNPLRRWNDQFKKEVYDSRIMTSRVLSEAVVKAKVPPLAFISMSGVGFYPPSLKGEKWEEESKGGDGWMTGLVKDWEEASTLPSTVVTRSIQLRSGVVLGRRGGMVQQTILPFFLGLGGRMGAGSQIMPWIHVKDVAGLILHSLTNANCRGVYNAVAPSSTTNLQFVKAFGKTLRRPAIFPLPAFVFETVFGPERASMITDSQLVFPKRTLDSGYKFLYPTVEEASEEFAHLYYVDSDNPLGNQK